MTLALVLTSLFSFFLTVKLMIGQNYGLVTLFSWFSGLIFLVIAFFLHSQTSLKFKIPPYFILLFFLYCIRLLIFLSSDNIPFHGDEAIVSQNALIAFEEGINQGKWDIFAAKTGPVSNFPALWYYLQGAIIKIFGPSLFSIKLFSLFTDLCLAILVYQIFVILLPNPYPILAPIIYWSLPISIHFSLTGLQNIQSTLFHFLAVLFVLRSLKSDKLFFVLLSGISSGLGFYFYLSSAVSLPVLILFLILFNLKNTKSLLVNLITFLIGLCVTLIPYLIFNFTSYNFFSGRSSVFNIWLTPKSGSTNSLFYHQTLKFFSGFYPKAMNGSGLFYINQSAIPNLLSLVLFLLGLFWLIRKIKQPISFLFFATLVFTSLFGGILTESPPAPQRLINIFPLLSISITLGIYSLFKTRKFLAYLISLLVVVSNLHSFLFFNLKQYSTQNHYELKAANLIKHDLNPNLYTYLPPHEPSQVFFYSKGRIKPIPVNSLSEITTPSYYFLTNNPDLVLNPSTLKLITQYPDYGSDIYLFRAN